MPRDRALLDALFVASPFSVALYDIEGRLVAANDAYEKYWGIRLADVPPDWSLLTDPQLAETGLRSLIDRAYRGEHVILPPVRYEGRGAAATGGAAGWSQGHCVPVRDDAGVVTHVAVLFADISAIKESEQELGELADALVRHNAQLSTYSQALEDDREALERVVAQLPAAITVMEGPELRIRAMSGAFQRFIGGRDVIGMPIRDALPELSGGEPGADYFSIMERVFRTGEPYTGANMMASWDADGDGVAESHYVDLAYAPLRSASGDITGVTAIILDVTERAEAIHALTESEARFRNMADAAPVMLWVTNEQGICTFLNRQWLEYTGQSADHGAGYGWLDAVHPDDAPAAERAFTRATNTESSFIIDYRLRRHDGVYRWMLDSAAPRLGTSGEFLGFIGSVIDVDERARLLGSERAAHAAAAMAAERARMLQQLTARLNEATTREQIADAVFIGALTATGADAGTLAIVHLDGSNAPATFEMIRMAGFSDEITERYRTFDVVPGRPLSDAVLQRRSLFLCSGKDLREVYPAAFGDLQAQGYSAFAALPVAAGDRVLAIISFSFREEQTFDEPTCTFLETLAEQCALALERQRLHDAELRYNAKHAALLETIQDAFLAFDESRRFTYVNPPAERLLGRSGADLLGRRIEEVYPETRGTPIEEAIGAALRDRRAVQLEALSAMARCWVEARIYPSPDGVSLVMQDITQRRRAQGAQAFLVEASRMLTESLEYEAMLRAIADAAVPQLGDWCAVDIVMDPTSGSWPPMLERLAIVHGDARKLALARELAQDYPTDWSADTGMARVIRDGTSLFIQEVSDAMVVAGARDARHLGLLRELQFSSIIVVPLSARGLTLGALTLCMTESGRHYDDADLALAQDLAQRAAVAVDNARLYRDAERARADAEAANHAKSQFLATMSHELRTPLNAIQGHVQLMELGVHGHVTDAQRDALERIARAERHLLGLIDDVLRYARLESGRVEYDLRPCSVGEILGDILPLVEPQFGVKAVRLEVAPSLLSEEGDTAVAVLADRDKLGQVLLNLLTNALKFTEAGGMVRVTMETEPPAAGGAQRAALLRVEDTGIGIARDKLEAIFEPFVQVRSAYGPGAGGTGLGLAISRDLARGMGGDLTVDSTPGLGSTFTVHLQLADELAAIGTTRAPR